MTTDAELIKAAQRDPEAFGELYRRHATAVNRWFRDGPTTGSPRT